MFRPIVVLCWRWCPAGERADLRMAYRGGRADKRNGFTGMNGVSDA